MSIATPENTLANTKYQTVTNGSSSSNPESDLFLILNYSQYLSSLSTVDKGIYENARFSTINKLDFNDLYIQKINRAGLIYFSFIDGELHLCFGKDRRTGDVTDFSGLKKRNETSIECALREGYEESRKVFGVISIEQISKYLCLYNSQMLIIFIPVIAPSGIDIRKLTSENFQNKTFLNSWQRGCPCFNEISELLWFNENEIANLFSLKSNHKMYTKVRRFIYSCRAFSESIDRMKKILGSGLISHEIYELYESQFRQHENIGQRDRKRQFPRKRQCFLRNSREEIRRSPSLEELQEKITIPDFSNQILQNS